MRVVVCLLALVVGFGVAAADDKVLVLKAEGRADKGARAKIEKAVLELAKTNGVPTAGDITYSDAAAMVGCMPDEDACKQQVVEMLSVDEIVTIAATPKPGGIEVTVRRIGKLGATRSASALVTADTAHQLDAIAPLFGRAAPPPPAPAVTTPPPIGEDTAPPADAAPPPAVPPPAEVAQATPSPVTAEIAPAEPRDDDQPPRSRRLAMLGMGGGGVLLVTGIVFWASAKNVESEIADAPKRTRDDLEKLQELEDRGDTYATVGNVLAVTGLVVAGVSTYFFLKRGKRSSRTARVTPAVFGDGAGIAITWGSPP
jgi:hypothetical protein